MAVGHSWFNSLQLDVFFLSIWLQSIVLQGNSCW